MTQSLERLGDGEQRRASCKHRNCAEDKNLYVHFWLSLYSLNASKRNFRHAPIPGASAWNYPSRFRTALRTLFSRWQNRIPGLSQHGEKLQEKYNTNSSRITRRFHATVPWRYIASRVGIIQENQTLFVHFLYFACMIMLVHVYGLPRPLRNMPTAHLSFETHEGSLLCHIGRIFVGLYGRQILGPCGVAEDDLEGSEGAGDNEYHASSRDCVVGEVDSANSHVRFFTSVAGAVPAGTKTRKSTKRESTWRS